MLRLTPSPWEAVRLPGAGVKSCAAGSGERVHLAASGARRMTALSSGALSEILRGHQLLMPAQLAELPYLVSGRGQDARPLAKMLVQRGWLTVYQVNQLLAGHAAELV